MPKMDSTDTTVHAAHDLINSLQNPEPEILLVIPVNPHKESLRYIADIFVNKTSPAVPLGVPVRGAHQ